MAFKIAGFEHLLDHLDKRVRQRQPPPQTLDQLCQMLQQQWRTIPRKSVHYVHEMRLENFVSVLYSRQIARNMHEFCFAII
jgi:hypothetical protein